VALHGGAAAALLLDRRRELVSELRNLDRRRFMVLGLATGPAGVAGLCFEQGIETRLGTPATIAAGLLAGALAMALADRSPQERGADDAHALDALCLGLAQACALMPGVSRNGATLAAARALRFTRAGAGVLSRQLAYPVVGGATALKAWRLRDWRASRPPRVELGTAALVSFASTLATRRRLDRGPDGRRLLPYALYRVSLALIVLARLRQRCSEARRRSWSTSAQPGLVRSAHDQGQPESA
jgi:undecaprenyl-diphosphatase